MTSHKSLIAFQKCDHR